MIQHEIAIRLSFFFGLLAILALAEHFAPKRQRSFSRKMRWTGNLAIVGLNTLAVRLLFPIMAMDMAVLASNNGWGLLNLYPIPHALSLLAGVVALDLIIYVQHVVFHYVPFLWRFHRMHHADLDFDVTTGTRFHPIEIMISMGIKITAVALLGLPALSVLIFEILLNATSMITHSNLNVPLFLDRIIRTLFVTPDMHRVHHSIEKKETNSNFGFNLSIWDRIFHTYKAQPDAGHKGMTIGLEIFRKKKYLKLPWMLVIPFIRRKKK